MTQPIAIPATLADGEQLRAVAAETAAFMARFSNYSAASYTIGNELDYDVAVMDIRGLKSQADKIEAARKAITQPKNDELRAINATFALIAIEVVNMLELVKRKTIAWQTEQRRIVAEAQRQEQERAAKREALLRAQAEAARAAGKGARADVLEDRAAAVVAAPIAPPPKAAGIVDRVNYSAEIFDAALVPREFCVPDEKALNALARALKDNFNVAGVRLVKTPGLAVRK